MVKEENVKIEEHGVEVEVKKFKLDEVNCQTLKELQMSYNHAAYKVGVRMTELFMDIENSANIKKSLNLLEAQILKENGIDPNDKNHSHVNWYFNDNTLEVIRKKSPDE